MNSTDHEVFKPYVPFCDGDPHPTQLCCTEVGKLASPEPPTDKEMENLLAPSTRQLSLSNAQLDMIALSRKQHNSNK